LNIFAQTAASSFFVNGPGNSLQQQDLTSRTEAMFAVATAAFGVSALPVAAKAIGELHRAVFQSNVLARQGMSVPQEAGAGERLARQRAGGIKGGTDGDDPQYMSKVPRKALAGDTRKQHLVTRGSATSSKGILDDILAKVPRKANGTGDYQRAIRPVPTRAAGYGNQSYPQ
jgi:hypothetical protein